ncbi:MAG: hypothetical protein ABI396_11735, partial [Ktedonobacteraceae bacterium]
MPCHSERSEGSHALDTEILHCAQNDSLAPSFPNTLPVQGPPRSRPCPAALRPVPAPVILSAAKNLRATK